MNPVCGLRFVSIVTALACLAHVGRLFLKFQILIGSHAVPLWVSGVGVVVFGGLSLWFWKLSVVASAANPSSAATSEL